MKEIYYQSVEEEEELYYDEMTDEELFFAQMRCYYEIYQIPYPIPKKQPTEEWIDYTENVIKTFSPLLTINKKSDLWRELLQRIYAFEFGMHVPEGFFGKPHYTNEQIEKAIREKQPFPEYSEEAPPGCLI